MGSPGPTQLNAAITVQGDNWDTHRVRVSCAKLQAFEIFDTDNSV